MRFLTYAYIFILCFLTPSFSLAATDSAEADFTPWSGYWWPSGSGGLATGIDYRGHPAPIEKYELLKDGSYPGPATQWSLVNNYKPGAPSWYGLCHAWAAASVYEHIEFYPSSIENIIFYVGDKKGLLTVCHQTDVCIRENSHPPEVFHWWLLHYIKDNGVDFYAELEPGVQVWNYPVFKYEMEALDNGDQLSVTCQIWYADDMVDPDIQGTKVLSNTYTYTLYRTGDEITGGEWTGASVYNHPQQLVLPVSPGTNNPYLDYDFIRSIATSRDDYLESDQPVELNPGGYNLILLNEDVYAIPCDLGDMVLLGIEKVDDFEEGIQVMITDGEDSQVFFEVVDTRQEIDFTAGSPPYTLILSRDDYGGGGVYRLEYDLKKAFEFASMKIQKGFGWGGFAITNGHDAACESIYVVGYTQDGQPMETYVGPFSLLPGEKITFFTSDFDIRVAERNELYGVKILAPFDLGVVSLFGYFERNMSCYTGMEGISRFVIPDTCTWWDFSRSVSWGVYNPMTLDSSIHLSLFSPEGELSDEVNFIIPANQAQHYNSTGSPFTEDMDGGWILIEAVDGSRLTGYVEWLVDGVSKAEVLPPLKPGNDFFVPHVISSTFWGMKLTVINVSDSINQVTFRLVSGGTIDEVQISLNPREKRVLDIEEIFPAVDQESFNASALFVHASDEIAGFYTFETPSDDVYYPLMSDDNVMQELILPHVASNEYWWTGINLFNPSTEAVEVSLLPYDNNGDLMGDYVVDSVIEANQKDVFTVADLFGTIGQEISFLKIRVSSGPGLAGVFGYGNTDCSMLSGGVMR